MGLNKPQDLYFVPINGNVKRTGGTKNLANGQVGLVNLSKGATKAEGTPLVDSFALVSKRDKLQIREGSPNVGVSRSLNNKDKASLPFSIEDVENLTVNAPKQVGIKVDDMIIGYNGTAGSEIVMENGDNELIQASVSGKGLGYKGYKDAAATVQVQLEAPNTGAFTMEEIIEKAAEEFKNSTLLGQSKFSDLFDVIVVNSENPQSLPNANSKIYYNLILDDDGTYTALGKVQAQFPSLNVMRTSFDGTFSTYTVIAASAPSDYSNSLAQKIKGCEDCPAGYSEIVGGFVYNIAVEDDGTDISATIEADVPGAIASSAVKNGQDAGLGFYSVVTDDKLTNAELVTLSQDSDFLTSEVTLVGEVSAVCSNATTTDTSWVEGKTCESSTETYTITVADDDCGNSRLADLQAAYPDLTIAVSQEDQSRVAVTLTGTTGTANITLGGVDYLATFTTDLATTAANFVTSHGSAISAAHEVTVTSSGAEVRFTSDAEDALTPTIANVSGDLAGTVGSAGTVEGDTQELCQTTFQTVVETNIICDECSAQFRDSLSTEAPASFEHNVWTKAPKTYSATAKMGLRFRAKPTILSGGEALRDNMNFVYEAPRLSLVGGFPDQINESYKFGTNGRFTVKILDTYSPPQNMGGNLRVFEDMGRVFFEGMPRHEGNNYAKYALGEETRLEGTKQYIDYALTIHRRNYSQSFAKKIDEGRTYHFYVEVGRHSEIEALLNELAAAAGVPTVQAYGK